MTTRPPASQTPTYTVWLAYTPEAFTLPGLASHLPAWAADAAPHLRFNGSFFLAAAYSLYYLALEPVAGGSWTGGGQGRDGLVARKLLSRLFPCTSAVCTVLCFPPPVTAAFVGLPLWAAANCFCASVPDAWAWALGLHLLSWFAQIAVSGAALSAPCRLARKECASCSGPGHMQTACLSTPCQPPLHA